MKIIVSYSGGKDSQACLIWAIRKYGHSNVTALFCDTGWEHKITMQHIDSTISRLGIELIKVKGEYDFISLAKKKGRFPSTMARFCTVELKVKPMIDWILSQDDSLLIIQGIRSKESAKRSEMAVECNYFKHYFEELNNGRKYSYRGKEVREWCKTHDASVLRPIFNWSAQGVIDYILDAGMEPNPLYKQGMARVGCFPCIMCRKQEAKLCLNDEYGYKRIKEAEEEVGINFFAPGYIPKRLCKNGEFPTVDEVKDYVNRNDKGMQDMFEPEEGYSCMSLYHGLCE